MGNISYIQPLERLAQSLMDVFRGTRQTQGLRSHLSALFLLKFVSDVKRDVDANGEIGKWRPAWRHLQVPKECHWDSLIGSLGHPQLASLLDNALRAISENNSEAFGELHLQIQFCNLVSQRGVSIEALSSAVHIVSRANLRPSNFEDPEELGDFFERLLLLFAEVEGSLGEFLVPPEVGSLMALSLAPQPGETILDPLCGSGVLLSRLARHAGPNLGEVLGQVRRSSDLSLCRMNLLFRGVFQPWIDLSDSLKQPLRDSSGQILNADVVVSNPPFNSRLWGNELQELRPDLFLAGATPRSPSELLFLSHMIKVARDGKGRIGIIVANGALFRNDGKEIRRAIVEENLLSGVIALPAKLFQMTAIPISILLLDKSKKSRNVVFIDASSSFKPAKRQNILPETEVLRIAKVFHSQATQPGFSNSVALSVIRDLDYKLTVPLYVKRSEPREATQSTTELSQQIVRIERELENVQGELDEFLRELGFTEDNLD